MRAPEKGSQSSWSDAVTAVAVVMAVLEALKRIPPHLRGTTFFSAQDQWFYIAVGDDRVCADCSGLNGGIFDGNYIRYLFPWLRVIDEDTIFPMLHPSCRCVLHRVASLM
jgi:hypothetical protein